MKNIFNEAINELFYVLCASFFIFSIMELLWPRLVLAYININLVLIFALFIGIFIVVNKNMG